VLTPNAVRLSALVAAAVSAGYLWRAALDHHAEQKVPVAVAPAIQFKPGAGLFNSLTGLRDEAARIARQEAPSAEQAQVAAASDHQASAPASGSQSVVFIRTEPASSSSHRSRPTGSTGSSQPRPKPHLKPPRGGHPVPPPVSSETKPGWGKGDRHHVHTGPPGHSRRMYQGKGKAKGNGPEGQQQGWGRKNSKHDENDGNDNHQGNEEQRGNGHQGGGHGNHH